MIIRKKNKALLYKFIIKELAYVNNLLFYLMVYYIHLDINVYMLEDLYLKRKHAHAWSLVRVNGNWLPFDATWGIFTGKLPVCHIFEAYFPKKKVMQSSIDKFKDFEESRTNKIGGKFIE